MGGDPWVYDKMVHSNKNNNKLIQLLCTVALNKAIYSGVGGVERQNNGKVTKNKVCELFVYSRFRYLQENAAANCRIQKMKKARLHCNWVIGEGKLVAYKRCHIEPKW